jgi:predicted nucleic acid-binding protein
MAEQLAVIDASLAIKAILPNPDLNRCQAAMAHLQDAQMIVPALWVYEITSTFSKAVHWGQISTDEGREALHLALNLGVQVIPPDEIQCMLAFDWTLRLKRASAYDSFYLAIAEALQADFWTADQRLYNAFKENGLEWMHFIGEGFKDS